METIVTFSTEKEKIQQGINIIKEEQGIKQELILLDGFVTDFLNNKLSSSIDFSADFVLPMVVCVGGESGQIYYFSYKFIKNKMNNHE